MAGGTSGTGGEPEKVDLALLENVQNRLTAALVKQAIDLKLKAADWVQGGWSRAKADLVDRIDVGYTPQQVQAAATVTKPALRQP
ncbi:MAG: hypothetical protein ACM3UY_10645 [Methanocella sp.]